MPYSTGSSDDSGYSGVRTNRFYSTDCFYDFATSSIACSDEDDEGFRFYGGQQRQATAKGHQQQPARNSKRRSRKNKAEQRRFAMQLPRPASTPNSISSSCSSEPDSLEDDSRLLPNSDSVLHLYMYFQSLLLNIRRQQRFFEQIARIIGDGDARWGAHGHKNSWKFDPSGCYAPLAFGDKSKSAFFPGCWAVPHPVVYLELLGEYIRDYLAFLKRTYPVGRPMPRAPGDECGVFGQRLSRNGDMASISSEEIVPALMKFIQQQSSTCSPDQQDEGKVLPMLNSSAWPAVGPRIDTDSSGHVSPSPPLVSPTKQNYSSVVARCSSRSSTSESVKDGPILYSTKAASNLSPVPQHEGARFDAIKPLCPPPGQQQQYKDQRGGSPVLPVSIAAAAAAAASNKTRNDNSLTFAKTHPPCPPPTTPVDIQGQFEVSKMDVLSEQIWHYHNSITQTEAMLTRKLHLRDMLYYAISPIFPMCGLYVVGSSLNGFGNNSSDMDLCLMITNKDLDQKTDAVVVLNMILTTLSKLDWVSNQHLILAKVPILRIKFTSPWQDITVDLNANNSVAIKNTHLLCYYSSFDWRVRPLVSVVKEWAKKKGINDANRSSFTSYSLVLMVIHYLQCGADPAILPSLQVMYPKRFHARVDVRTLNVTQPLQHPSEEWQYQEKTSLGELFIGFLNYYANKFDYDRDAISVRQGRRVDRASLAIKRPHGTTGGPPNNSWRSQWRCICIEEPFTQSNTAHSIYDEMVFGAIKSAFRDAHEELEKNRDLHSLLDCRPISVSLPHNGAVVYAFDNSAAASSTASPSPTAEVIGSSSINSINTAMTRSSSSANSVDGEEAEKVHSQSFDHSRRKSSSKRGGGSSNSHQQGRKPSSSAVPSVAVSPVVSC